MNLIYIKHRLLLSICCYIIITMLYFAIKEMLIPKMQPVFSVDTKFALSVLNRAKEEIKPVEKPIEVPVEKPVEQPIEKPVEQPKPEPAQQEAPKPEPAKLEPKKEENPKRKKDEIAKKPPVETNSMKIKNEKLEKEKQERARKIKEQEEKERKEQEARQREIDEQTVTTEAIYEDVSLNNQAPKYPIISKKEGEEGEVILLVKISSNGTPVDVILHKSSGYERLDNASMYAVKTWRFKPAKNKFGGSLESVVYIPFIFQTKQMEDKTNTP